MQLVSGTRSSLKPGTSHLLLVAPSSVLSSAAVRLPSVARARAVNTGTVAVQGSSQLLAPELGEGVGQLGRCPEGQVGRRDSPEVLLRGKCRPSEHFYCSRRSAGKTLVSRAGVARPAVRRTCSRANGKRRAP